MSRNNSISEPEKINLLFRTIGYKNIDARLEQIDTSHDDKYEWMFEKPTSKSRDTRDSDVGYHVRHGWSDFSTWLTEPNAQNFYWIQGIPGAGKSTVAKFAYQHHKTHNLLRKWADADKCRLFNVGHFFWGKGNALQYDLDGLLRSVIFQVLSSCIELRLVILKPFIDQVPNFQEFSNSFWTTDRLQDAFRRLVSQTTIPMRLCIFVDGLDETSEIPDRLTGFLELCKGRAIKVCATSRPWAVFQDFFRSRRAGGMYLHRFAASDVLEYVTTKLHETTRFRTLERSGPVEAEELRSALVERAQGSFVWVKVVLKLLNKGLRDGVSLAYLRRQVQLELPAEVEQLYALTLDRIPDEYRRDAALVFSLYREAQRNKLVKHSPARGLQSFWALRLLMADAPLEAMKNHFRIEELDGLSGAYSAALRHLRHDTLQTFARLVESRTGGLLVVADLNLTGLVVLHKSVDDFLNARSTRERLRDYLGAQQQQQQQPCDPAAAFDAVLLDTLRHGPATTWLPFMNNTLRIAFIQTLIPGEELARWHRFIDGAMQAAQEGWRRPRLRELVKRDTRLTTDELLPVYLAATGAFSAGGGGGGGGGAAQQQADDVVACLQQLPAVKLTPVSFLGAAYPCHLKEFISYKARLGYRSGKDELTATLCFAVFFATLGRNTDVLYGNIQWLLEHGADPSSAGIGAGGEWNRLFNEVFRKMSKEVSASSSSSSSSTSNALAIKA